jgi:hypothetical protein
VKFIDDDEQLTIEGSVDGGVADNRVTKKLD